MIASVPTFTGTPKGIASNSSSRLLVYLHGGAYVKGACDKLWQVGRMGRWYSACSKGKGHKPPLLCWNERCCWELGCCPFSKGKREPVHSSRLEVW